MPLRAVTQELQEVSKLLLQKLRAIAQGMLKMNPEDVQKRAVRSNEVSGIAEGLGLYKNEPGVADLREQVQEWIAKNMRSLQHGDFCHFAAESAARDVADLDVLERMVTRMQKPDKIEPSFEEAVVTVVQTSLTALLKQARVNLEVV